MKRTWRSGRHRDPGDSELAGRSQGPPCSRVPGLYVRLSDPPAGTIFKDAALRDSGGSSNNVVSSTSFRYNIDKMLQERDAGGPSGFLARPWA